MTPSPRLLSLTSCLVVALASVATAQTPAICTNEWLPGNPYPGANSSILAMKSWDPDGSGPATPVVVMAGAFTMVGECMASNIATYDPATGLFGTLDTGTTKTSTATGWIYCLTTMPNGDLVAGGDFEVAGGVAVNRIARWNGSTWAPLGPGLSEVPTALAALPNGDVVATASFTAAGGSSAAYVTRWDGTAWTQIGTAIGSVQALTTLPTGELVAGGQFASISGQAANNIARWNGTNWSPYGAGLSADVRCLAVLPNGTLLAGGAFSNSLATWNGTTWSSLPAGFVGSPSTLAVGPTGIVWVGGNISGTGVLTDDWVMRFDNGAWSNMGSSPSAAASGLVVAPNGDLIACGPFTSAGGNAAVRLARWNGTTWSPLRRGFNAQVRAVAETQAGLVVGGDFTATPDGPATRIARHDGTAWQPLGSGLNGIVNCVAELANGDLVVGGTFFLAGGVSAQNLARWDGVAWSQFAGGRNGTVNILRVLQNGDVLAGGAFPGGLTRWDGATWSTYGPGFDGSVSAIAFLPNGELVAGGAFVQAGTIVVNRIARWDGISWFQLGGGTTSPVSALAALANGDLIAGGGFVFAGGQPVNGIARWDGKGWFPLGAGSAAVAVNAIDVLPDGDLLCSGSFTIPGSSSPARLGRWDGTAWSSVDAAFGASPLRLVHVANGDVMACGSFTSSRQGAAYLTRLTTTCPATAQPLDSGCPSSGGANVLTAATLPWVQSTFRAKATGVPQSALVLALTGLAPIAQGVLPLASVFSVAPAGCDVLVGPDIVTLTVANNGTAVSELFLPNTPPLVGVTFHHQLLPFEIDPQGAIVAVTATNRLQLLAGSF